MDAPESSTPQCGGGASTGEDYDLPLHIAAVFMVLGASLLGAGFPVAAKKWSWLKIPAPVFFACKHFGTGVLVATAFVHLLPVAFSSLTEDCLDPFFTETYPALPGVIMMGSMFILFVIEMYLTAKVGGHSHGGATGDGTNHNSHHHHPPAAHNGKKMVDEIDNEKQSAKMNASVTMREVKQEEARLEQNFLEVTAVSGEPMPAWFVVFYEQYIRQRIETINMLNSSSHTQQQLGYPLHRVSSFDSDITLLHKEGDGDEIAVDPQILRKMSLHITLLEGGILFHSIFVGITISITTDGFIILLVAILFHQMFEGVGLGSRIASVPYPSRSVRPWILVAAFCLTCPIGQAIGLLTRGSYDPESSYGLITVGVFNAMSSGLLIYAALVNLLAEDFLSQESMQTMAKRTRIEAFLWVLLGAIGMSVIGAFA